MRFDFGPAEAWVRAPCAFLQPGVAAAARPWLSGSLGSVIDLEMCCECGGETLTLLETCLLPVAACS